METNPYQAPRGSSEAQPVKPALPRIAVALLICCVASFVIAIILMIVASEVNGARGVPAEVQENVQAESRFFVFSSIFISVSVGCLAVAFVVAIAMIPAEVMRVWKIHKNTQKP